MTADELRDAFYHPNTLTPATVSHRHFRNLVFTEGG
jgi:hypothetical protein